MRRRKFCAWNRALPVPTSTRSNARKRGRLFVLEITAISGTAARATRWELRYNATSDDLVGNQIDDIEVIKDRPKQCGDDCVRGQFDQQSRPRRRAGFRTRNNIVQLMLALHAKRQDCEQQHPPDDEICRGAETPGHSRNSVRYPPL